MMWHARSAWWLETKSYARRKPHALASTPATPKKNVSCFFDLAGVDFFLKMERTFFFGVLPSKYSGSAWGFNTDSAKRKSVFLGERIFRFASADFPPAGGVWGGMRAGFASVSFAKNSVATSLKTKIIRREQFLLFPLLYRSSQARCACRLGTSAD